MKEMYRNILFLLSVLLCLTGCDDVAVQEQGPDAVMSLQLCPVPMNSLSFDSKSVTESVDEGTSADYHVADFWLFEYGEDGNLVGTPRFYSEEDYDFLGPIPVTVILPSSSGVVYTAVIVANTHDESFLSKISYNSLNALKSSAISVMSSEDLYRGEDLLMNGMVDITSSTSSVNCMLFRNVAGLTLNINNEASSGVIINSVQLKNVPHMLFVADQLNKNENIFPNSSLVRYGNLEKDELDMDEGSGTTLTYYLPRNKQGTNSSVTEAGKNVAAPTDATYVEVFATRKVSHTPVRYRFYLGANNINDFNIVPNHKYEVTLDFSVFGDANDNRVEDLSVVKLEDSNSYMVNPSDGMGIRYMVPIEHRINTYWRSESGKLNSDWVDYLIGYGQEWIAEVIWQDVDSQVIRFCNEDGSTSNIYEGLADDRYFSFITTDAAVGIPCNVLIGVRRASDDWDAVEDGYMWSWHLWLTDYDPYEDVGSWVEDKYVYPVAGGSVQRYSSFDDITGFRENNVYIMDRNLGAKGYTRNDGWAMATGTLYQFGRKDPFPASDNLYDISGASGKTIGRLSGILELNETVSAPMSFVKQTDGSVYDWSAETRYINYDWNDLLMEATEGDGKSFFDPCPPGWKLPYNNIWFDFGNKDEAHASNWTGAAIEDNEYFTSETRKDAGWLFYLNGKDKVGDVTYYPSSGMRNYTTGNYGGGGNGALWSAKPANTAGTYLYYDNSPAKFMLPSQTFYRYMGMPVRCITSRDAE